MVALFLSKKFNLSKLKQKTNFWEITTGPSTKYLFHQFLLFKLIIRIEQWQFYNFHSSFPILWSILVANCIKFNQFSFNETIFKNIFRFIIISIEIFHFRFSRYEREISIYILFIINNILSFSNSCYWWQIYQTICDNEGTYTTYLCPWKINTFSKLAVGISCPNHLRLLH